MQVDAATRADAAACAAVYAPYVRDTVITFELDPPDEDEMAARIVAAQRAHAWLVARDDRGRVVGYAYGGPYHSRPAYRWTSEVSIYLDVAVHRAGLGRALYTELFAQLTARGLRTLVAGMTLPNAASVALHRSMGFERIGVSRRIGWKHGAWHDVAWCQRPIGDAVDPPAEPR